MKMADVYYCVKVNGRWLAEVKNLEDYAGIIGKPITDIAIKMPDEKIKYRVHIYKGGWLTGQLSLLNPTAYVNDRWDWMDGSKEQYGPYYLKTTTEDGIDIWEV